MLRLMTRKSNFTYLIALIFCIFQFFDAKVTLSPELVEVLQRKSNFKDPENRIIVAFKTQADPMESLQKAAIDLLSTKEYRAAIGNFVLSEMNAENLELEQELLLEHIEEAQIVRRLPIGNAFVLEGLSFEQADKISKLERTVLLSLSKFTQNLKDGFRPTDEQHSSRDSADLKKCGIKTKLEASDYLFNEPIEEIKEWENLICDSRLKTVCQPAISWNIKRINSPQAWKRGFKGKGIVYGVIDTGVSYKHMTLSDNYYGRKFDGSYDHNYAWYDAVRSEPKIKARDQARDQKFDELNNQIHHESQECKTYAKLTRNHTLINDGAHNASSDGDIGRGDSDRSSSSSSSVENGNRFYYEGIEKIHSVVDKCGFGVNEPCDAAGHGSHVTSTAVGSYGIGAAPDAKWMACRSITKDIGREEDSIACLNFFFTMHDLEGKNPRPELRPHVIGNSYGWGSWAEVTGAGIDLAVRRLESAGTLMVFAAGNSGPSCGTIHSAFSLTVGAITEEGSVATFSSRGPWTISPSLAYQQFSPDYHQITKPEISAPGRSIVGAYGSRHIAKMSGTSMASPHVSGSVALLRKNQKLSIFYNIN